jgi:hypothetical protein
MFGHEAVATRHLLDGDNLAATLPGMRRRGAVP